MACHGFGTATPRSSVLRRLGLAVLLNALFLSSEHRGVVHRFYLYFLDPDNESLFAAPINSRADGTRSSASSDQNGNGNSNGDDGYLEWLLREQNRSIALPLDVHHRGQSGLGHQLVRLSCVYHLAAVYKIPRVHLDSNPMCGTGIYAIHNYLLGPHDVNADEASSLFVDVPPRYAARATGAFAKHPELPDFFPNLTFVNQTTDRDEEGGEKHSFKTYISINNDVHGYDRGRVTYAGSQLEEMITHGFWGKESSDFQMYNQMMLLFGRRHADRVRALTERTGFDRHTVFGLHVRTGNGEGGDFAIKGRTMKGLDEWIARAVRLFCDYREAHRRHFLRRPLMLYVGTDTASVVPRMQAEAGLSCRIPVVSAEQRYPGEDEGVSFSTFAGAEKNRTCLEGWRDMFLDMYMFARCNTVVAGTYSSFTQAAPLSFVMHKAKMYNHQKTNGGHPHYFCEMGADGSRMDCFDTLTSWLRRTDPAVEWGNLTSPRRGIRHEVQFPKKSSASAIASIYFDGTMLREEA